jgi:CCR4-NOT transcription complex subunit 7/8
LKRSGIDFEKHRSHGIPAMMFGEYISTSGLLYNPETHWITFHGGVDFGYFMKLA